MTKEHALLIALEIINECKTHEDSCGDCIFSDKGLKNGNCLLSDGNDIPKYWSLRQRIDEWMGGE